VAMNRNTAATYKRGAIFVVPVLLFVGCRVGLRACVALDRQDRRTTAATERRAEDEAMRQAEQEMAAKIAEAKKPLNHKAPTAASGFKAAPLASAQQVPDALAVNADVVAWLSTRSGEVVVAPRAGGAPRVVAKDQKLPQRRHLQGLALGGGYVWWITQGASDDEGAVMRAKIDGGDPEAFVSGVGGLTAITLDEKNVYFARSMKLSRLEDGAATGGVWRMPLKGKDPQLVVPAERPCAIAVDDQAVYVAETLQIWRAAKKGPPKTIVTGGERLGCSIALDDVHLYWTLPGEDTLMRAKKTDGSSPSAHAFLRKRPWNVVVDRGYAYALTETSPQAFGELGSVFRVPLRAEAGTQAAVPEALVVDRIGLNSVAASNGFVVFSDYNESESDGTVTSVVVQ
jgi:hypothetical protein